jgi:hypothetical protein
MLAGVCLVIDDAAKGPVLPFSYPLVSASSSGYFARLLRPKSALCNRPFSLTVDTTVFIGFPVLLKPAASGCGDESFQLSLFHVVLVCSGDAVKIRERASDTAQRIASALLYEEGRCGYVTGESAVLLKVGVSGDAANASASASVIPDAAVTACGLFPALRVSSLARELAFVFHSMRRDDGNVCTLRINNWLTLSLQPLRCNPSALSSRQIQLHDGSLLELSGPFGDAESATDPLTTAAAGPSGVGSDVRGNAREVAAAAAAGSMVPIRPYHSLLLLHDQGGILRMLPADASPQLITLVRCASPVQSIRELQGETGIPSAQLLRLAAHLVHWGLAIILTTVTSHAVYTVHPGADLKPAAPLADDFLAAFPQPITAADSSPDLLPRTLAAALSLFSSRIATDAAQPLIAGGQRGASASSSCEHDDSAGGGAVFALPTGSGRPWRALVAGMNSATVDVFTRMLAWLLKHSQLQQMHVYVYLLWPWSLSGTLGAHHLTDTDGKLGAAEEPSQQHPPLHRYDDWAPQELDFLQACTEGEPDHVATLLRRLVSYLREVTIVSGAAYSGDSAARDDYGIRGMPPILQLNLRLDDIIWRLHSTRQEVLGVLQRFPELFTVSIHV